MRSFNRLKVYAHRPSIRLEPVASRFALIALSLFFSGAERYFSKVSKPLHYGFDLVLLLALVVLLLSFKRRPGWLKVLPYGVWICVYFAWGLLVSPDRSGLWPTVFSEVLLNALILSTIALAVTSISDVAKLGTYVQLAVVVNLAVAVIQAIDWHVLAAMARLLDPTTISYNIYRPAGLWVDPNLAGISYLFGFLVSLFVKNRQRTVWVGQACAVVGILLTGSREAMYPLLLCCVVLAFMFLRKRRAWARSLLVRGNLPGISVAGTIVLAAAVAVWLSPMRVPIGYGVRRFVDASFRGPAEPSRVQLANLWIQRALHGPWFGSGVFSFQGNGHTVEGAHNIYITVWGEAGGPLLVAYLAVLVVGMAWMVSARIQEENRVTLALMWLSYLALGFTWHNQFSAVEGIFIVGLLYRIPSALGATPQADNIRARPAPFASQASSTDVRGQVPG